MRRRIVLITAVFAAFSLLVSCRKGSGWEPKPPPPTNTYTYTPTYSITHVSHTPSPSPEHTLTLTPMPTIIFVDDFNDGDTINSYGCAPALQVDYGFSTC